MKLSLFKRNLKRVINLFNNIGLEPIIAPEIEFYLVKKNDPDYPLETPLGNQKKEKVINHMASMPLMNLIIF